MREKERDEGGERGEEGGRAFEHPLLWLHKNKGGALVSLKRESEEREGEGWRQRGRARETKRGLSSPHSSGHTITGTEPLFQNELRASSLFFYYFFSEWRKLKKKNLNPCFVQNKGTKRFPALPPPLSLSLPLPLSLFLSLPLFHLK